MHAEDIFKKLKELGTAQNIKIYRRHGAREPLFGVSFANLNTLKKSIISEEGEKGVNQEIAEKLWDTKNSDAMTLAAMIAEPDKITEQLLDQWVTDVHYSVVADYIAGLVGRTKFASTKIQEWSGSDSEYIKRTGYAIIAQQIKEKNFHADNFYLNYIERIEAELQSSPNRAKEGMNNCLIAIGGVNETLKNRALITAKNIGPVEIDHGETSCQTFVIEDYIEKIWARKSK